MDIKKFAKHAHRPELWSNKMEPDNITRSCLYTIVRDKQSGRLVGRYETMPCSPRIIEQLRGLAHGLQHEESDICNRVVDMCTTGEWEDDFVQPGCSPSFAGALSVMKANNDRVRQLFDCKEPQAFVVEMSGKSCGTNDRGRMASSYSQDFMEWPIVPEGQTPKQETRAADAAHALELLSFCKKTLASARDEYDELFSRYCTEIEELVPGITTRKDYCTELADAYVDLDYSLEPTNTKIIDKVVDYYLAQVHEDRVKELASNPDVIGVSERYRGWRYVTLTLDAGQDLKVIISTNFGYGLSSYFYSTLSYAGVAVPDASFVVFYQGVNASEYSQVTDYYDVDEKSFKSCFDKAIAYANDYAELGPDRFIEKYILTPLQELAQLMERVCKSRTFVTVSDFTRFHELTSEGFALWLPGDVVSAGGNLSQVDKSLLQKFADSTRLSDEGKGEASAAFPEKLSDYFTAGSDDGASAAQQVTRIEHARRHLTELLQWRFGERDWISEYVVQALPMPSGIRVDAYEDYELYHFRTERAMRVLDILSNLSRLAKKSTCEEAVRSLVSSCRTILAQDVAYLHSVIDPNIAPLSAEVKRLETVIAALKADAKGETLDRYDREALKNKLADLTQKKNDVSFELTSLEQRKRFLEKYAAEFKKKVADAA